MVVADLVLVKVVGSLHIVWNDELISEIIVRFIEELLISIQVLRRVHGK